MISAKIKGDKEVLAVLQDLQKEFTHKQQGAVHLAAAKPMIKLEAQLAPIDEGDLSASIGGVKTSMAKAKSIGEVAVGPRRTRQHRGFHGHLVEKGTKRRTNKKGANRGVMPAQPFAEPAFEQTKTQVVRNITDENSKQAMKVVRRHIKR